MMNSLRIPAAFRRVAFLAPVLALALGAACSGDDPVGPPDEIGIAHSATRTGSVGPGTTAIVRFVAGQSGPTRISMCGPAGTNFDLYLPQLGRNGTSSANCETLTFDAEIGTTYRVEVTATSGAGPFNFCYGPLAVETPCTVTAPAIDATIPAGYYNLAEGKTGTSLLTALHAIIDDQRVLTYDAGRDSLYSFVEDQDNDDVLIELYVGDPREGVNSRATALLADLNAEHTWPQSLGADNDPPESDLHHLFAADETANNRRSNNPFGNVVSDTTWVSPLVTTPAEQSVLGRDSQNRVVFEPRDSKKGDIARAILYFYVRYNYQRPSGFSLANFNIEEATLLEWARQDPPDEYERARHNLVYRAQGNRNPFIDRPDFLDAVGDFPN